MSGDEDFALEIRQVDAQGNPTNTVLVSTIIPNVLTTPIEKPQTLVGAFSPPAPVTACQQIALSLTINPGQTFNADTRSECTGSSAFQDPLADGSFIPIPNAGLISAIFITV